MFTNAPGSQRSCSEHKWADRGLSPRNRGMSGLLDLSVRHSIFPGHSSTSWAPTRSPVTRWLCHRYPAACHGAERQAEHHKFCVYSQKRLIPVSAGNTQHMQGELPLQQAHPSQISPLGWQRHPGLPPVPAQSKDRTLVSKSKLHKHIHAPICTEEPPESLLPGHPLAKDVTTPQCHQSFLSSWESQKASIEWAISSCHRNIQQDTAWQLVMSVALNHKHFELFWYNGKLWEGERKRRG